MTSLEDAKRVYNELAEIEALCAEKKRRLLRQATELLELGNIVNTVINETKGVVAHEMSVMRLSHRLTGKKIASPDQIINSAVPVDAFAGVYFLIRQGKIVYVGQSRNVFSRVLQHPQRQAERWAFIPCDPEELDLVESLYIHMIRPEGNGCNAEGAMTAPLSMDALFERMRAGTKRPSPDTTNVEDC